ncbi:D-2-hydroxyglutarate dehydrogenase [Pacificimonas flava]|uniref:D-2-hydroxyglutarate dehydrogenase n=1 Tax=Pacificimonas flava TaxID=1234595 RepID=M2TLT6_9SPHN|nr:D-2-hydroxyglutarate dehydrogenase [Pacificimonas flava]
MQQVLNEATGPAPLSLTDDLRRRFIEAAGAGGAITDPTDIAAFTEDWRGTKTGNSPLVLRPADTQALSAIVRLANETRTPLVPQGGNTSLCGASVPEAEGAVIISLQRMNRIRTLDAAGMSVTAEAGVILQTLHEEAAKADRMFPLSLGAKGSATIGGLISTNAGGTQVLRYGTMRAQVLGLEAVLPDGSVLDQLTPLRKDNTGYDIKQLLIGAEGTLGFVTAASLRLLPAPKQVATAFAGLAAPEDALTLLTRMQAETGGVIDSFELVPRIAIDLVTQHVPGTRDPFAQSYPWYVLIELTSSQPGAELPEILERALVAALEDGTIADTVVAQSETQREDFWRLRETIAEGERADGPSLKHDISVPVADMPRFVTEVGDAIEARWPGAAMFSFGHLGDGNIHFNVRSEEDRLPRADLMAKHDEIAAFVYDRIADYGGSISAEHGIGTLKAGELARIGDPAKLVAMRAVKQALDPHGIMNPGKLFA